MCYTTIFGAYSAYLFVRTGHFVAPCVVHAFCNHMGFPDFSEALSYKNPQKSVVAASFVVGFLAWFLMLKPFTDPAIYYNTLFWQNKL